MQNAMKKRQKWRTRKYFIWPLGGSNCGLPWSGAVYHGPSTDDASSNIPMPVQEILSAAPDRVGTFKTGAAPALRARKARSALGFEVSFTKILVPSGNIENHSRSAPPVACPATNLKGYTPAAGTPKPTRTSTFPKPFGPSHSATLGAASPRIVAVTPMPLVKNDFSRPAP